MAFDEIKAKFVMRNRNFSNSFERNVFYLNGVKNICIEESTVPDFNIIYHVETVSAI